MNRSKAGKRVFTLAEVLIVIVIIAIVAAIAIPRMSSAGENAQLTKLKADLNVIRRAIEFYTIEHNGRTPDVKENGQRDGDGDRFVGRLVGETDMDGECDPDGEYGPYLRQFPENAFIDKGKRRAEVRIGGKPAGANEKGWHYDPDTGVLAADSAEHASL